MARFVELGTDRSSLNISCVVAALCLSPFSQLYTQNFAPQLSQCFVKRNRRAPTVCCPAHHAAEDSLSPPERTALGPKFPRGVERVVCGLRSSASFIMELLAGNRLVQELPCSSFLGQRGSLQVDAPGCGKVASPPSIGDFLHKGCLDFFHRLRLSCRARLVVLWHRWVACCVAWWVCGSSGGSSRSARSCSLARCLARVAAASSGSVMRCCTAVRGWVKWRCVYIACPQTGSKPLMCFLKALKVSEEVR